MLDGLVGVGNSIVRVTAQLDFQQVEKTSELYDPNATVIRSQQRTEESKTTQDKQEEIAESTDENNLETSITNYEINKTVEHIINSVGTISRLSVAVLLDGIYTEKESEEGIVEQVYEPRPQEEIDRISAIVKSAIGFDSQRSDQIEVVNLAFDKTSMEFEQNQLDTIYMQEFYLDLGKKVGMGLLAIIVLLYLRKKAKKLFAALGKFLPQAAPIKRTAGQTMSTVEGITDMVPEPVAPIIPEKRVPKLVDQMTTTAKKRPEEMAKVIKTMMSE
jgi:flagellar M-ring protein FliF